MMKVISFVKLHNRCVNKLRTFLIVACRVGDWVDVDCDYSPGVCSEGGTGVVVAISEGNMIDNYECEVALILTHIK